MKPNVEVSGLRGFLRRSDRLPGWRGWMFVISEVQSERKAAVLHISMNAIIPALKFFPFAWRLQPCSQLRCQ